MFGFDTSLVPIPSKPPQSLSMKTILVTPFKLHIEHCLCYSLLPNCYWIWKKICFLSPAKKNFDRDPALENSSHLKKWDPDPHQNVLDPPLWF